MPNDSGQHKGTPPSNFGLTRESSGEIRIHLPRGWQEETPAAEEGAHVAPRAPKETISRIPFAERLRQRAAGQGKG